MRKLIFFFTFALLSVLHTGCSDARFYKKYQDIPKIQWKRDNVLKYEVDIQDSKPNYKLALALRYVTHIQIPEIKMVVDVVSPAGKKMQFNYAVRVKDDKGKYLGEVMGEMGDIESIVEPKFLFSETGKYQFLITQATDAVDFGGIQEVGLVLYKDK